MCWDQLVKTMKFLFSLWCKDFSRRKWQKSFPFGRILPPLFSTSATHNVWNEVAEAKVSTEKVEGKKCFNPPFTAELPSYLKWAAVIAITAMDFIFKAFISTKLNLTGLSPDLLYITSQQGNIFEL